MSRAERFSAFAEGYDAAICAMDGAGGGAVHHVPGGIEKSSRRAQLSRGAPDNHFKRSAHEAAMTTQNRILQLAQAIRSDAWVEDAGNGAFRLGFVKNHESMVQEYNDDAERVAAVLKASGFRVKVRGGNDHWPFAVVMVRE